MKYLLYYKDGFLKKFPLEKKTVYLGRSGENDLVLDEDDVSRRHLQVETEADYIVVRDLNSTNGAYMQGRRISTAVVRVGQSFSVNGFTFYLRQGGLEEFQLTEELDPVFEHIKKENRFRNSGEETRYVKDIYSEILKHILKLGMSKIDFNDFLFEISAELSALPFKGSLFLITGEEAGINIKLSVKSCPENINLARELIEGDKRFYANSRFSEPEEKKNSRAFASYPLAIGTTKGVIIYIGGKSEKKLSQKLKEFLGGLSREISLLAQVIQEPRKIPCHSKEAPVVSTAMVAVNRQMRQLVEQSRRIAASSLFVLIQGESGTGKELFARLLHDNSKRASKRYVAINCAAIPENLLESELFGYEKGAFTGAYAQKKGKLELASGGTLVLDEIGDMPLGLQVKLLRVLQEHEFYRVAGEEPIKVDLRIVSLTNFDLKFLIEEGNFRKDLYYRLAHHVFTIPPLRERREDIPEMINVFTRRFCRENEKRLRGYSVQAYEILQDYSWPGNVRQLENEINRLVNLADYDGMIGAEMISRDIRCPDQKKLTEDTIPEKILAEEDENQRLLRLLKKNSWNKSRTARELGMTYQGLHKKMKRLQIEVPNKK